jgi:hypothetical protein
MRRRLHMPQVDIDIGLGAGTFDATIIDPQGNPAGPASVIQASDPWRVDCTWQVSGVIALFSGTWRIQVLLEGLGGGAPEFQRTETEPMVANKTTPYTKQVTFPAGSIVLPATEDSLSFNVNAVLTARTSGNAPLPVAALVDLGVVEIYRFP